MKNKTVFITCLCFLCLFLVYVFAFDGISFGARIRISEVCSHNATVRYNETGEYNDYIVVTNYGSAETSLLGYCLSDDFSNLDKFVFPDIVIAPGESITVWADFGTNQECGEKWLHCDFAVSDDEDIYLTDAEGRSIDHTEVPILKTDQVFARIEGTDRWEVVGREETLSDIKGPSFSVRPGFYDEDVILEIIPENTDGEIFYTLNGERPTKDSSKYEGPIVIKDRTKEDNLYASGDNYTLLVPYYIPDYPVDKCTVVRAVTIDKDGEVSREAVGTYFIGYENRYGFDDIPVVSVVTDPDGLFGDKDGIYVTGDVWKYSGNGDVESLDEEERYHSHTNYNSSGRGWKRNAYIEYFGKDHALEYEQSVLIGIHGNYSNADTQKSLNLFARPEADGKEKVFEGLMEYDSDSFVLRNGGDLSQTKFRDVLNQRLAQSLDMGTQDAKMCQVFLDGEYWGLYNFQERISPSYIQTHFGVSQDNLILIKNNTEVVCGQEADYELFGGVLDFAANNDLSETGSYEALCEMIDIDSFIDFYAFTAYTIHTDALGNNIAVWRSRQSGKGTFEDTRWRVLLYDTDQSTGYDAGTDEINVSVSADGFTEGQWHGQLMDDVMFSALWKNAAFRERFNERFEKMSRECFDYTRICKLIDEYYSECNEAAVLSHRRYFDPEYKEEQYNVEVETLKAFFRDRYAYIRKYLDEHLAKH